MKTTNKCNINLTFCLLSWLPIIMISCSVYQKVSLSNFEEYRVPFDERANMQYVLKARKLHYSTNDKLYNNFYEDKRSKIHKSHSVLVEDNIVIPVGAHGVCVNSYDDNFIIDFGKGILVPFEIHDQYNRAKSKIEVDGRMYSREFSNRNARLYFVTRGIKTSKSRDIISREGINAQLNGTKKGVHDTYKMNDPETFSSDQ